MRKVRDAYREARDTLVARVFRESTIVMVTLNNSGCKPLVRAFRPSVIYVVESGQASIAALCVPLLSYRSWQGVFLFGDPNQLKPIVISIRTNEAAHFAQMSPLEMLINKGYDHLFRQHAVSYVPCDLLVPGEAFLSRKTYRLPVHNRR